MIAGKMCRLVWKFGRRFDPRDHAFTLPCAFALRDGWRHPFFSDALCIEPTYGICLEVEG